LVTNRRPLKLVFGIYLFWTSGLLAQNITLSPLGPTVTSGGTVQFTETGITGTPNWYAGGVLGGTSSAGTVSATGLYQAPTGVVSQFNVKVAVKSGDGSQSASTTVTVLPAGGSSSGGSGGASNTPVITSVTPNPLTVGTVTVTINGTNFQNGVLVYDSYGSQSMIQTAPATVTPTSLTVTVYLGVTGNVLFQVRNPGSSYSNSVAVPVTTSSSGGSGSGGAGGGGSSGGSTAPTITSVTPNPLTVGTVTVTITGTNFQSGVLVYDSYGSQNMIQTAPTTVTPTSLTVSVYLGVTGNVLFQVRNPGSSYSNSVAVPVTTSSSGGGSGSGGAGSGGSSGGSTTPTITTVTPNPLTVGTVTVTITGTNFQSGVLVYDSYGSQSMIQTAPTTVTPTSLTVSVYLGLAGNVLFQVRNPGSAYSNSVAIPVTTSSSSGGSGNGGSGGGSTTYTLSVVNGMIIGSSGPAGANGLFAAGAVVTIAANAPAAGQAFSSWTGANVANPLASQTTLTMPASNTLVTANFYTPAPIPFPVTTHPRLWITPQDLPRLQSWALPGNTTYQGIENVLGTAIGQYNAAFPGAALSAKNPVPASPYPDFGDTQGYTGMLTEEIGFVFAFNSLIDPSATNRSNYAQAARNLIMYAMNQAALGQSQGAPFRDPSFPIYNRASFTGHEWPLIVDWIYNATDTSGNPILTSADKLTIRNVFMTWAADCLTASTTGGDNPGVPGLVNSLGLFKNNLPYRMASNNYYLAHARLLTMMSLALDPSDDPPVSPNVPAAALGNSLRSYIADATGAWLYEEFAMMGDPAVVAQAYQVPNNPNGIGWGLASGGLPPEGMLYGESFAYVLGQLLALQTAGFNNAAFSGPQIGMIGAPVWDRYVQGYLSSLTPTAEIFPSEAYLGSVFQFAGYGDLLRLYETPDQMPPFALLALLDQEQGISTHVSPCRWMALNGMPNGAAGLLSRIRDPWTWGVTQDILYYLLLDPNSPADPDPRPAFPTVFYDAPAGRVVAHSDWSSTNTMFDYRASWISINHQDGAGGEFGLYRKGEWLTKEMSNYDNGGNGIGATTEYHNSLALQNWCQACAAINWANMGLDGIEWLNGSQWMEGEDAGDPTTSTSTGPGYVYAASDLKNLFNRPNVWSDQSSIGDITQATRSILWLNNDYIVVYDRATSVMNGLFKRFNMSLVANPVINGNTTTDTLPSGQQLFVQTLLPANASITSINGAAALSWVADLEPTRYILTVQDPTMPADTRFLHVVQGADAGAPMAAAAYVQSSSGTPFDGAVFNCNAVYFPVGVGAFSGATFPAPACVHTLLVTGLNPNTGYSFNVQANGAANTVIVSPNGSVMSDAAGVLRVTF
jgi:hypothetical protein